MKTLALAAPALTLLAAWAAVPAAAQPGPCESVAVALARFVPHSTDEELADATRWLQEQIDGRPAGMDPCTLTEGMVAHLDSFVVAREGGNLVTEAAPAVDLAAVSGPEESPYALPFGSGGHRVDLVFTAPEAGVYGARLVTGPAWVRLSGEATTVLDAGADGRLSIPFEVAADAPIGTPAVVSFELVGPTGVAGATQFEVVVEPPVELALSAPSPNPARGAFALTFTLPAPATVSVSVFDVLGRRAAVLAEGDRAAGAHVVRLDGRVLAAGAYVVRLSTESKGGHEVRVRQLTIVR